MHSINRIHQWKNIPGNWDVLNLSHTFDSGNSYGIPDIVKSGNITVSSLIPWGSRPKLLDPALESVAVHFFLDDYRFESLWKNPARNLDCIASIGVTLTPDFSLWSDMPIAMQIWQTYRNRYIGCYWQTHGIHVIPTISWSDTASHDFCFAGVARGSQVAISTVGVGKAAYNRFQAGFEKMLEVIQPTSVLCYGSLPFKTDVPIMEYPTRWQQIKMVA